MDNVDNEIYEAESINTGCGVLIWGALLAFLILLISSCFFFSFGQKMNPVKLSVEPFVPADTCALVYDMSGFSGDTLFEYFEYLDSFTGRDGLYFVCSPTLLSMYRVEFKGRKACLDDLLNQAVSGTDLAWECVRKNILIWRK